MIRTFTALCLLFILAPFITQGQASLVEVSGPVSGTWNSDTVLVTGDIQLLSGESLEIAPGTLVLFTGHFAFDVKGSVVATGTTEEPVRFSVSDTAGFYDTLSATGGWHGLVYEHLPIACDSSLFDHCIFEYGKAFSPDTFGQYGGAFRVFDFDRIAFRNCTFNNNFAIRWGGAVYAKNSNLLFDHCSFTGNTCGLALFPWGYGGGICSVHAEPVVTNCLFDGNTATGFGGGASFEYSDPVVRFNTFTNNIGGLAGGFGFLRSAPLNVVSENLVYGNAARFFGGGFACIRSNTKFSNLTVTDNHSMYGGGFYCNDSAVPVLYNTIIYGNQGFGHEVYIWDVRSAPSFLYCDIEGDTTGFEGSGAHGGYHGTFLDNIDADPLFRNSGEHPFAILPGSPCEDAGTPDTTGLQLPATDMEGLARIFNGRIDIGAYERNPGQGFNDRTASNNGSINIFPNPIAGDAKIIVTNTGGQRGIIAIFDGSGRKIRELTNGTPYSGGTLFEFDGRSNSGGLINSGIYIVIYYDNQGTRCSKLIK